MSQLDKQKKYIRGLYILQAKCPYCTAGHSVFEALGLSEDAPYEEWGGACNSAKSYKCPTTDRTLELVVPFVSTKPWHWDIPNSEKIQADE